MTSVVTLGLVLVNAMPKPSGLQAGQYAFSPAIWHLELWQAQMLLRPVPINQGEVSVVRFVEQAVPETDSIVKRAPVSVPFHVGVTEPVRLAQTFVTVPIE